MVKNTDDGSSDLPCILTLAGIDLCLIKSSEKADEYSHLVPTGTLWVSPWTGLLPKDGDPAFKTQAPKSSQGQIQESYQTGKN
ncbi:hypothetical protein J0S82_004928, partial [Galemys pyrenaicus]